MSCCCSSLTAVIVATVCAIYYFTNKRRTQIDTVHSTISHLGKGLNKQVEKLTEVSKTVEKELDSSDEYELQIQEVLQTQLSIRKSIRELILTILSTPSSSLPRWNVLLLSFASFWDPPKVTKNLLQIEKEIKGLCEKTAHDYDSIEMGNVFLTTELFLFCSHVLNSDVFCYYKLSAVDRVSARPILDDFHKSVKKLKRQLSQNSEFKIISQNFEQSLLLLSSKNPSLNSFFCS